MILKSTLTLLVFTSLPFLAKAQREVPLEQFYGLSVTGNIEVKLEQGEEEKVVIYTDGIPEDEIHVKVHGGELKLRVLNSILYKDEIIRVYVTYKSLSDVRAQAGAQVYSDQTLQAQDMELRAASGALVELDIQAENLQARATEGGRLILSGAVEKQEVMAFTGGQYEASDLECKRSYAKANTGGEAELVARELLEASANTGGAIYYIGDPGTKRTKTVIAGEVKKM